MGTMAGRPGLTVRAIEGVKAGPAHRDLADGRGLLLRVHPSGRKVWMVRATDRRTGERLRREMGEYGEGPGRLTLAQARAKAAQWRAAIRDLQIYWMIGRELASSTAWPNWYPGDEFRGIRDRSRGSAAAQ